MLPPPVFKLCFIYLDGSLSTDIFMSCFILKHFSLCLSCFTSCLSQVSRPCDCWLLLPHVFHLLSLCLPSICKSLFHFGSVQSQSPLICPEFFSLVLLLLPEHNWESYWSLWLIKFSSVFVSSPDPHIPTVRPRHRISLCMIANSLVLVEGLCYYFTKYTYYIFIDSVLDELCCCIPSTFFPLSGEHLEDDFLLELTLSRLRFPTRPDSR